MDLLLIHQIFVFKVTNFESVFGRSLRGHKRLLDSLED